jgi:hypothetical protein
MEVYLDRDSSFMASRWELFQTFSDLGADILGVISNDDCDVSSVKRMGATGGHGCLDK